MAEAVIGSIAEKIAEILGSQPIEIVGKLWGVEHELKELKDTVSMLRPVLEHAEEQYHQISHIRVWVEELKDAFYEAQDVLEEFNIEAMQRELRGHNEMTKKVRTFFSSSNQLVFNMKMSDRVRAVRQRIQAIKAERKFHLDMRPMDSRVERERRKREETHSFISEKDITGRDDDKKMVMKFILDANMKEDVSILPIIGIGGLGKTALAQFVYNDEMVSKHFHIKMWVCVSSNFNLKQIVTNIITSAKKEVPSEDTMDQLQSKLRREIHGKRYLLILDDLWNEELEKWLSLKKLLVGGARGSKILITTRIPLAAKITGTASPYHLKGLSESASLDLLLQMANRKVEEIHDSDMLAIGKEIVRKCCGVPLVIRIVGSLLLLKESKHEWSKFKDDELPNVFQREDSIKFVLKLSYDHLPSHLKQCFAFCSLFPKTYAIKKQTLINLWMAEGFIQPSNRSQHLEDIADGYFMDLLWRNFFHDFNKDQYTKEETCKMHDLIHDLACLVAGTECWVAWDDQKVIHDRTRHISYDLSFNSASQLLISRLNALRTFLSVVPKPTYREMEQRESTSEVDLHQLIQSFKRLRILDLHSTNARNVPRSICELKHLTYLDLSHNEALKRLPNSITRLQNLQTLNLHGCDSLEELPRDMRKLVSLRNLDIDRCDNLGYLPRGLGQLSSLHKLTRFILPEDRALAENYCELGELNGLNNIRESLLIENLESVTDAIAESKAANLIGKHSLESLQLQWEYPRPNNVVKGNGHEALLDGLRPHPNLQKLMIDGYDGESFPRWMMDCLRSSLPNLVEVRFYRCGRCKHLPPLGQLPHLKSLEIWFTHELECIETTSFPSLLRLEIGFCSNLKAMPLMPHLEDLTLQKVNPEFINQIFGLKKLKKLNIMNMDFPELTGEWWKSLASLETLNLTGCSRLTSHSLGIQHLSNLTHLCFQCCPDLDLCKDESGNISDCHGGLQNLRSVYLELLSELQSLPQWLLHASNLETLGICACHNLEALPEQIEALRSLQLIFILECPSLTSLPEGMQRLASLTHLDIRDCPELEKRCKRDAGQDWYKIAHVPNIQLGWWIEP